MAAVISIVSAAQMFIAAGCSEIYILGDQSICGGVLGMLQYFLTTFFKDIEKKNFPDHCSETNLLTCELIGASLRAVATHEDGKDCDKLGPSRYRVPSMF